MEGLPKIKHAYVSRPRAMYSLLRKISCLQLEIDTSTQLVLFDSLILPVLLYGCEVWGHEITTELEKIHTKFCKNMLGPTSK